MPVARWRCKGDVSPRSDWNSGYAENNRAQLDRRRCPCLSAKQQQRLDLDAISPVFSGAGAPGYSQLSLCFRLRFAQFPGWKDPSIRRYAAWPTRCEQR